MRVRGSAGEAVARCRPARGFPPGTEWCLECNGYGSSLFEETERCTRCGGSGLVLVADATEQEKNGHEARRLGRAE
jgi:DnaJ-class molecular chaperone